MKPQFISAKFFTVALVAPFVMLAQALPASAQFGGFIPGVRLDKLFKPKTIFKDVLKDAAREGVKQAVREAFGKQYYREGARRYKVRYYSSGAYSGGYSGTASSTNTAASAAAAARLAEQRAQAAEIELARQQDEKRDVSNAIQVFIDDLTDRQQKITGIKNVNAALNLNINQVTEAEIRRVVDAAYTRAGLAAFERFEAELWTKDRLTVRIIDEARKSLAQFFKGVGSKGPSLDDLARVFDITAADLHKSALETMELLGVGHSFERLINTIYENSDRSTQGFFEAGLDRRFEKLEADVMSLKQEQAANSRNFLIAYRARRQFYDCMSNALPASAIPSDGATIDIGAEAKDKQPEAGRGAGIAPPAEQASPSSDPAAAVATDVTSLDGEERAKQLWKRVNDVVAGTCVPKVNKTSPDDIKPMASKVSVEDVEDDLLNPVKADDE